MVGWLCVCLCVCVGAGNTWEISVTFVQFRCEPRTALGFPCSSAGKESACHAGDLRSIPGLGRSPGEGNGNPLKYSCLDNSMDRGAWWAIVPGVAKSWTKLTLSSF